LTIGGNNGQVFRFQLLAGWSCFDFAETRRHPKAAYCSEAETNSTGWLIAACGPCNLAGAPTPCGR
jgi:hypothetical protein